MKGDNHTMESVVLLVDDKKRDLNGAALIALHLSRLGVECHLEPLEAFRAVLAAYRPGMIVFNHLTAGHLVEWSQKLARTGVLTAVLPNEGIAYDAEDLRYLAGRHHRGAQIDYVFSWNEPHRQATQTDWPNAKTRVEVVGVPRFDFYFEPWSRVLHQPSSGKTGRPRLLVCTNFVVARFWELPREEADRFFAPWIGRIAIYNNYWRSIEAHWKARRRFLDYLDALVAANKFEIVLRPHPREESDFYVRWLAGLPDEWRRHVKLDVGTDISALILQCDLEISCETCTTAIESWMAGKPTIELIFERDPLWYREEHAQNNIPCDDPKKLPGLVERQLRNPAQPELSEMRRRHLEKWCASPDGGSSLRLAHKISQAMRDKKPADWSQLTLNDYRRAIKMRAFGWLGLAYHFDPVMPLKRLLFPKRYAIKDYSYKKSIKPQDVLEVRQRLEAFEREEPAALAEKNAA
jgi:surface carbohydrate biosynthesis protein